MALKIVVPWECPVRSFNGPVDELYGLDVCNAALVRSSYRCGSGYGNHQLVPASVFTTSFRVSKLSTVTLMGGPWDTGALCAAIVDHDGARRLKSELASLT